MFKRIDLKYGDNRKVVEQIISEIKSFPKISNKNALIKFVDLIEVGYRDLKLFKMEDELSNFNVMGIIESKLPDEIGMQWFRKLQSKGSLERKGKFEYLLEHLTIEQRAVEYSLSDVRRETHLSLSTIQRPATDNSHTTPHCWQHNADNHPIENCRTFLSKPVEERASLIKEHSACWTCMQQGHQSKECWNKRKCEVEGCQKFHNASLHKVFAAGIISHTSKVNSSADPCILLIMSIPMYRSNKFVSSLWDSGATINLITFHKAKELNL